MHVHGLTGLRKALCESRLGYLTHVLDMPGQYKSVALMLSHKMDFNCCANRDDFRKSSHICDGHGWFNRFVVPPHAQCNTS